jgi:hypothetical protein
MIALHLSPLQRARTRRSVGIVKDAIFQGA